MSGWGEIPVVPDTDPGIMAIEREQITKPRTIEVEGPRLHQPSSRHSPPTNDPLPADRFQFDSITLHTIKLLQHTRKLRHLIHTVQQQLQENLKTGEADITYPATPNIPEFEGPSPKHALLRPVPFMPVQLEDASDFVKGCSEAPPVIDDLTSRKLLRRSVATICAHAGYDTSSESVLEMLTDLTGEYFIQITKHMRAAADHQALNGPSGFADVMVQVFSEMGLGSITSIHDFYQTRIIQYHDNMIQTCQQLTNDYSKLKNPGDLKGDTFTLIKIKEEPYADIQFPSLEDTDEDPEQLLQLEGLSSFEITVEQESTSGLTTDMESKWMMQNIKPESADSKASAQLEAYANPGSVSEQPPSTPAQLSDSGEVLQDPPSIGASDIMSPPSVPHRPSAPKKKKKEVEAAKCGWGFIVTHNIDKLSRVLRWHG